MRLLRWLFVLAAILAAAVPVAYLCLWAAHRVEVARKIEALAEKHRLALAKLAPAKAQAGVGTDSQGNLNTSGPVRTLFLSGDLGEPIGSDLAALAELDCLDLLDVSGYTLSGGAMRGIGSAASVGEIWFEQADFPEDSLSELERLPHLITLRIHDSSLTDAGVARLARLKHLWNLEVVGCPVTDAAVADLSTMTDLCTLTLDSTRVSQAAARRLAEKLPRTKVHWVPWDPKRMGPGWERRRDASGHGAGE